METNEPPRLYPPTTPGPVELPVRPPRWPGVIGVVAIVTASWGILTGLWGVFQQYFIGSMYASMAGHEALIGAIENWRMPMVVLRALGVPVAGVLLGAGVLLVRRRPGAVAACLAYAALRTVQGLGLAAATGLMQRDMFRASAAAASAANPAAGAVASPFGAGVVAFTAAVMAIWTLALPVFLVVWFTRRSVREHVRSWRAGRAAAPTPL